MLSHRISCRRLFLTLLSTTHESCRPANTDNYYYGNNMSIVWHLKQYSVMAGYLQNRFKIIFYRENTFYIPSASIESPTQILSLTKWWTTITNCDGIFCVSWRWIRGGLKMFNNYLMIRSSRSPTIHSISSAVVKFNLCFRSSFQQC